MLVAVIELLAVGFRYAVQIAIARLAGAEAYGLYIYALTWAGALAIPAGLGLSALAVRYVPTFLARGEDANLRTLLRFTHRWTIGISLMVAVVGAVVFGTLSADNSRDVLVLAALVIPLISVTILQAETLRGSGKILTSRVVPNLLQPALILAGTYFAFEFFGELTALSAIVAYAVALVIAGSFQGFLVKTVVLRGTREGFTVAPRAMWLRTSLDYLWIKVGQLVLNNSDIIIVGVVLGPFQAGIYAAAVKTAVVTQIVTQAVNLAVPPDVARSLAVGRGDLAERAVRKSAKFAFGPTLVMGIAVIFLGETLLGVFGPEFGDATTALTVLVVGRLVTAWTGPVGSLLNVTGHQRYSVVTYSVAAVVQVVLLVILVPSYGITGAAIAVAVAMIMWNVVLSALVVLKLRIRLWPLPILARPEGD